MALGGGLTLVVVPVIALVAVFFGIAFAIGFGASPSSGEVGGLIMGALIVVGAVVVVAAGVLILALTGQAWAQWLLLIVGVLLAFLACPFPVRLGADHQRPEDIQFTVMQLGVMLLPATLAVGALLRLLAARSASRAG